MLPARRAGLALTGRDPSHNGQTMNSTRRKRLWLAAAAAAGLLAAAAWVPLDGREAPPPLACANGAYGTAAGPVVVTARHDGALLWRSLDGHVGMLRPAQPAGSWRGTRGWTSDPDGVTAELTDCRGGLTRLSRPGVAESRVERMALPTRAARFAGAGGTPLEGRLVMPAGDQAVPVVVLAHGAERGSALDRYFEPYLLAASGIGVFVYDKRGTGLSGGDYTQELPRLAGDLVAAADQARRLAGARLSGLGLVGFSQGGWVAALAAKPSNADFMAVLFGSAASAMESEQDQVAAEVAKAGHGEAAQAQAREMARVAAAFLDSRFENGAEVARARQRWTGEPWFKSARGDFTGQVFDYPPWLGAIVGRFVAPHTTLLLDPRPFVDGLDIAQLWLLAGDDVSLPPARSASFLRQLASRGKPIDVREFPGTEHGLYTYRVSPAGERESLGYPAELWPSLVQWIQRRSAAPRIVDARSR